MNAWIVSDGATWDILVIGGGATGLGTAVELPAPAVIARSCSECEILLTGPLARSTKLIHGGVRYLAAGQHSLWCARHSTNWLDCCCGKHLHLVHSCEFVVPAYHSWQLPYYGMGLWLYDRLAGKLSLGRSRWDCA